MEAVAMSKDLEPKVHTALSQCALFRALKADQLGQVVKVAELVRYEAGEPIVRQGEASDSFFVVVDGSATVSVEKAGAEPVELGEVPLPSSIGEVSLLLREPRTASVVATTPVMALKFSAKVFDQMFQKIPQFGVAISEGLAYRLHQLSGKMDLPRAEHTEPPSADVVSLLPLEFIQRQRVLPLAQHGNVMIVGMVDAPSTQVLNAIRTHLPATEIRPRRIEAEFFNDVLSRHAGVEGFAAPAPAPTGVSPAAPKLLVQLLERVVAEGASDLHLSAGHRPHWRIDGDMRPMTDMPPLGPSEVLGLLEPVMEPRHREQFAADNDVDLAYALPGSARFRVNVFRDRHGVSAVMRQIPSKILTFEQLALPEVVRGLCDIPKGLVLVTGPTGSGKSTTLAAMVDHLNRTKKLHIVTLEDPIEFVHPSQGCLVNQREVGGHTKSFARALRAALREDPDIVLVGEMRDQETVMLALETANTGHLVFATLHTNSAVSAIDRIIDLFPAHQQSQVRSVLGDVLRGVVAQTLMKKKGGGRMAALEILVVTPAVANLIRESKTVQLPGIMQVSKGLGMQLLNDELARFIETGKVEMEEALSKAVDKDDLLRRFRTGITLAQPGMADETFRVVNVNAGSPGATAGLMRGDVLVELDGKPSSQYTLEEVRQAIRIDGKRMITVDRGGRKMKIVMELGGREMTPPSAGGARTTAPPRRPS